MSTPSSSGALEIAHSVIWLCRSASFRPTAEPSPTSSESGSFQPPGLAYWAHLGRVAQRALTLLQVAMVEQ